MKAWEKYLNANLERLEEIRKTQPDHIMKAAQLVADATRKDGLIRVFGTGHSHTLADDVFVRAVTLANVQGILEATATGDSEISKAGAVEKLEGYAQIIVDYHKIAPPDVAIVGSNSGNNAMGIDFAIACRERNVPVIVLTNAAYSKTLKPRHSSGKHLMDYADVVVSNCSSMGDGTVEMKGLPMKVGPTSTLTSVFLINAILTQAVELMTEEGFIPDVYYHGSRRINEPEIGEHNSALIEKYYYRMKNL